MSPVALLAIRFALLVVIGASLTMMGVRVFQFRRLLEMPGGLVYVVGATAALLSYGVAIIWTTANRDLPRRTALLAGTPLGIAGAIIQIAHLTQEAFMDLGPVGNAFSGFGSLFCTFFLWGMAGYRRARAMGRIGPGVLASCWSAVVTMSLLIAFGFVLEFYLAVPKPEYVAAWGEFKRSGWTDAPAFTVVNTLDAAVSHLVIGPVAGAVVGAAAALIAHKREPGATIATA